MNDAIDHFTTHTNKQKQCLWKLKFFINVLPLVCFQPPAFKTCPTPPDSGKNKGLATLQIFRMDMDCGLVKHE